MLEVIDSIPHDVGVNGNSSLHEDVGAAKQEVLRRVMRRQAALSLRVAAVFILLLVALPLANLYLPEAMGGKVGGFPLTWLLLAVLFYPVTWVLSAYFVRKSEEVEASLAADPELRSLAHVEGQE